MKRGDFTVKIEDQDGKVIYERSLETCVNITRLILEEDGLLSQYTDEMLLRDAAEGFTHEVEGEMLHAVDAACRANGLVEVLSAVYDDEGSERIPERRTA